MKKSSFFKSTTATKEVTFDDGEKLNLTFAVIKRPYKQTKAWLAMAKESQDLIKAQGDVKKKIAMREQELASAESDEAKAGIQAHLETLNASLSSINEQVKDYIAPFADFLIPSDDSPRKVLLDWDLLDDEGEKVPATRDELEDLPDEVIVFIAGQLMGEGEVGEAKPAK